MQQTKTLTVGNCTVVIHRPELTPEERERRTNQIKKATTRLVIATEKERRTKE